MIRAALRSFACHAAPLAAALLLCAGCGAEPDRFGQPLLIRALPDDSGLALYDATLRRIAVVDKEFRLRRIIRHDDFEKIWGFDVTRTGEIAVANRRGVLGRDPARPDELGAVTDYDVDLFIFRLDGALDRRFTWRAATGAIEIPGQLTALSDGSFLVTDLRADRLVRIAADGRIAPFAGRHGRGPGELYYTGDVVALPDGRFAAIESFNSRAQVFDAAGAPAGMIAERGTAEGRLMFPQFGCVDAAGRLCVTELRTMRISRFTADGRFLDAIRPLETGIEAEVVQLYGIAATRDPARLYVCDSLNGAVHVFDADGRRVVSHRGFGGRP